MFSCYILNFIAVCRKLQAEMQDTGAGIIESSEELRSTVSGLWSVSRVKGLPST